MQGTHALTGKALAGQAHLVQSICDILKTPIGSRVLNRAYGSGLSELIDAPGSPVLEVDIYAEAASALNRWLVDKDGNPLVRVDKIQLVTRSLSNPGQLLFDLFITDIQSGAKTILEGVKIG